MFEKKYEIIENNYFKLVNKLALMLPGISFKERFLEISKEYLENKSWLFLKQARQLYQVMNEEDNQIEDLGIHDWSPAVLPLTKMHEYEISLSWTHWIRKELNIKLPDFYNKYQPGVEAQYKDNDFNEEFNGDWKPPMLGTVNFCLKDMTFNHNTAEYIIDDLPENSFVRKDLPELFKKFSHIRRIRNTCVHADELGRDHAYKILGHFENLNRMDYFRKVYRMKRTYRGQGE